MSTSDAAKARSRSFSSRAAVVVVLALSVSGVLGAWPIEEPTWRDIFVGMVFAQGAVDPCPGAAETHTYNVVAIPLKVVYNNFGDHDPNGRLLVRADQEQALRDFVAANPWTPAPLAAPLVLRAHVGDCVVVNLENKLPAGERTGLHVHNAIARPGQGLDFGNSGDDTVAPGQTRQYVVYIPDMPGMEGAHFMHSHDRFQQRHGLFGAIAAQPKGATWLTPQGQPSLSGAQAIIAVPGAADFREYVVMYHDEIGSDTSGLFQRDGTQMPQVSEFGEYGPGTKGINLRSEPFRTRFLETDAQLGFHDKSQAYGSYTHGDPAMDIQRAYVGDPAKWRTCNVGPGQHHVHHLHGGGDRWRFSPLSEDTQFDDVAANGFRPIKFNPVLRANSDRIDVQNMGPGECYNQEIEGGAGGVQMAVGDFLYHCHIVEHYVSGMWAFWRVFNTLQADLAELPDHAGRIKAAVNSLGLIGRTLPDGTVLDAANIRPWIESHLPDRGVRTDRNDASVWDWSIREMPGGPLYLGEPETASVWPNYPANAPGRLPNGERPELMFNQDNGRLAYPHLRPHLGMRPPFAPGHGPAPYLTQFEDARHPDVLCPAGAPVRPYKVVALTTTVPYNSRDVDSGGIIFVHAADKAAVLAGTKPAKSFVLRANQGDCVDILFSSQIASADSKVNMHIHLVNFDPQASDGVISGMQYEQSLRPAHATGTALAAAALQGATTITVADGSRLRVGTTIGVGLTEANLETHRVAAISGNTVTLATPLGANHVVGERVGPEFVHYAWYADVELGIVYWHDHVDGLAGWKRGAFASIIIEPAGSTWCRPNRPSAGACPNDMVLDGHVVDIVNEDAAKQTDKTYTFREAVVHVQENGGADGKWASLNLRNAPFDLRTSGPNPLSSSGNGDPGTDLWRAYPGDPVQVRLLYAGQGTDTLSHDSRGVNTFAVTGHRFGFEWRNPDSRLVDRLSFGISTHGNPSIACAGGGPVLGTGACARQAGDYLYYVTGPDFFERGAWGILRVYGAHQACPGTACLQKLPSNGDISTAPLPTGPVQRFDLVSMEDDVVFNVGDDIRENRQIFALKSDENKIKNGQINPQPVVLRALPGETVEIRLTNRLNDPTTVHLTGLLCNPNDSYGIPVGNNPANNIHVGRDVTKTFRCFADREFTGWLGSFGPPGSGSGGDESSLGPVKSLSPEEGMVAPAARSSLYGAIIVEPSGSAPSSRTGPTATLSRSGATWREYVLQYEAQDNVFAASVMPYTDFPDRISAINFRTEPLTNRVGLDPDLPSDLGAFSTARFGDPETPILTAAKGSNVVIRTLGGGGDQLTVHVVDGHWWKRDEAMAGSTLQEYATLGPGETMDAWVGNVGQGGAGDYFYGNHRSAFAQTGQWGILRVTA